MLDKSREYRRTERPRREGPTDVILLIDASGSMQVRRDETIREVNRYLKELKRDGLEYRLTVKTFNESVDTLITKKPIREVGELEHEEYRPNGWTRLLDAVGDALDTCTYGYNYSSGERYLKYPARTLFVVVTDGEENSSKRYSLQDIRNRIDSTRSEDFQFVFLGDGPGAWQTGNRLGFNISVNTDWTSPVNTENIYKSLYRASNNMAQGQTIGASTFTSSSTNAQDTTPTKP